MQLTRALSVSSVVKEVCARVLFAVPITNAPVRRFAAMENATRRARRMVNVIPMVSASPINALREFARPRAREILLAVA